MIRMHWSVENGCHWTMDVMLGEDDAQPCQASRDIHRDGELAPHHWLQRGERWRQLAPRKDRKPMAWARAMETLRDALLLAQVTDYRNLVQPVT